MAKIKEEKLSLKDKLAELDKQFKREDEDNGYFVSTGSIVLNKAYGGGYKTGRVYEYLAWEGAGKTTLSLHAVAEFQKKGLMTAYIDAEHALDETYANNIGVKWNDVIIRQPDYGEQGWEYAKGLIKTGEISLLVIDSISGMLPKKMLEGEAGDSNLGLHARLTGQELVKVTSLAAKYNCCVILISQFREKIGVMFGNPETTQGGNAPRFWASVRTELRKSLEKEGDDVVGITAKFKVIKNKVSSPYKTGELHIEFGKGIQRWKEVKDLAVEEGIIKKTGNTYSFKENKLGVGEKQLEQCLLDNPELLAEIETALFKPKTEKVDLPKLESASEFINELQIDEPEDIN